MTEIKEMNFEELLDWACGHALTSLIKGELHNGMWLILHQAFVWKTNNDEKINS